MSNVSLEVYLFFHGQCEEAMNFYKDIFGGKLESSRYSDMPPAHRKCPVLRRNGSCVVRWTAEI